MGDIDRINPLIRPILGPRSPERVQPDTDRRHQHHDQPDELDLSNGPDLESPDHEPEVAEVPAPDPDHRLDLSI